MINTFSLLPDEIIQRITAYGGPQTKRAFSALERRIQALVFSCIEKLIIFAPKNNPLDTPNNILETIVRRYKNLKKIKIQGDGRSNLKKNKIQPLLDQSPHLKTLILCSLSMPLSFTAHTQPEKLKLLNWKGTSSTLTSLKSWTSLKVLHIHYGLSNSKPESISPLIGHSWKDLTYLELKGLKTDNDEELYELTKDLKQLKCLSMNLRDVSNEAIEKLGDTCPELEGLQFSVSNFDNSTLDRLTQKLTCLKIIDLISGKRRISTDGVIALARNCKKLQCLWLSEFVKIEKSGFDALIENCLNLKSLKFEYGAIDLIGLSELVEKLPHLSSLRLFRLDHHSIETIEKLYAANPKLTKIERFTLNIGKMHQKL